MRKLVHDGLALGLRVVRPAGNFVDGSITPRAIAIEGVKRADVDAGRFHGFYICISRNESKGRKDHDLCDLLRCADGIAGMAINFARAQTAKQIGRDERRRECDQQRRC